jgi:hypothetical protein
MPEHKFIFEQREPHPDLFHEPDVDGVCLVDNKELMKSWFIPTDEKYGVLNYDIQWKVSVEPQELINCINELLLETEKASPSVTAIINSRHRGYFPNLSKDDGGIVEIVFDIPLFKGDKKRLGIRRSYPVYDKPLNLDQINGWLGERASSFLFYTSIGTIRWNVSDNEVDVQADRNIPTKPLEKFINLTSSSQISQDLASEFIGTTIEMVDKYKYTSTPGSKSN